VHSNLDRVEVFLNGQSLGAKDMKKDSHLAWNVKYAPGAIEARGFKDGKLVATTKRETTGTAAKLVMTADRPTISADGEDVAMFAVEVRDAQGRVVPITENDISFKVSGAGKLIGTGNGDPTNQQPDKGSSRKAFSGYCMALIQSLKKGGDITVEATSPGLEPARVIISAKQVALRPQVPVWEREVPSGQGVTGLWRPIPTTDEALARLVPDANTLYILHQNGSDLTGAMESATGSFFGAADGATPIESGRIDGSNVSFKIGNSSFNGTLNGDRIELERKMPPPPASPPAASASGPVIGPAPDGSDPSRAPARPMPASIPVVLHRVSR
jgi:beta-galactosidase